MSEDRMDAIVVGAGPAGSAAALRLARAGLDVALIERGATVGAKNMTGGRLYAHALEKLIPRFWEQAPVERRVTREILGFMTPETLVSLDVRSTRFRQNSFTVLRARFDPWLAEQAEEAGAMLAAGVKVDDLIIEDGRVVGVRAGEDEMYADAVIIAEGVNCLLPRQAGLRTQELDPRHVAVGVKTTIELPEGVVSDRFGLGPDEGAAMLMVGSVSAGLPGGGFLYTNRDSISLGLVITLAGLRERRAAPADLMERLKEHPAIAPLIDGGKVVEYSAHLVPEGGIHMMPGLYGDGVLVAGDAAGLVLNLGYSVRGMDLAIASGMHAADTVIAAKQKGDFSRAALADYEARLRNSFVLRELEHYKGAPHFIESTPRMFAAYPALLEALATRLFTVEGVTEPVHLLPMLMQELKAAGVPLWGLAQDAWKGMNAL